MVARIDQTRWGDAQQIMRGGTYLIVRVVELIIQLRHGLKYRSKRLYDVTENNGLPLQPFGLVEALRIYELHLLQDGRFARLPSTCRFTMLMRCFVRWVHKWLHDGHWDAKCNRGNRDSTESTIPCI